MRPPADAQSLARLLPRGVPYVDFCCESWARRTLRQRGSHVLNACAKTFQPDDRSLHIHPSIQRARGVSLRIECLARRRGVAIFRTRRGLRLRCGLCADGALTSHLVARVRLDRALDKVQGTPYSAAGAVVALDYKSTGSNIAKRDIEGQQHHLPVLHQSIYRTFEGRQWVASFRPGPRSRQPKTT